jgi:dihydrofolate synthase / folylpolyglutamate synthase
MSKRFSDSDELYAFLLGYVNVEKGQKTVFKLDRMRALCESLGNPQSAYRCIHVAGSKGKGSVSVMIARILEASVQRVGLYTSPHLMRWKERISLAGEEMPEDILLAAADEVLPLVEGKAPDDFPGGELPTYFELSTLIAFCAFRAAGCDRAVIETGLGGRLDSTNVVDSEASVITPIELEHTEWLGDTIALIASEKAGIIKRGKSCFVSRQRPEAREVIARKAEELGSALRERPELVSIEGIDLDASGTRARFSFTEGSTLAARFTDGLEASTPMIGAVQAENMALAILASCETEHSLGPEAVRRGLAKARLPARFEIVQADPPIVLDGAHTPDSVSFALESFEALFPGPRALLFACAEDKKHERMAQILGPRFDRITLTRPGTFKKGDLSALERSFSATGVSYRAVPDHEEAIHSALSEAGGLGLPLLVTGSFYLCSEFTRLYKGASEVPRSLLFF